jgi:hypothetical protein
MNRKTIRNRTVGAAGPGDFAQVPRSQAATMRVEGRLRLPPAARTRPAHHVALRDRDLGSTVAA